MESSVKIPLSNRRYAADAVNLFRQFRFALEALALCRSIHLCHYLTEITVLKSHHFLRCIVSFFPNGAGWQKTQANKSKEVKDRKL